MSQVSVVAGPASEGIRPTPVGGADEGSPSQAVMASAATATIATNRHRVIAEVEFIWQNGRRALLIVTDSFSGGFGARMLSGRFSIHSLSGLVLTPARSLEFRENSCTLGPGLVASGGIPVIE